MRGYFLAALTLGLMLAAAVAAGLRSFPSKITPPQKPADSVHELMGANERAAVLLLSKLPDAIGQYKLFADPGQSVSFDDLRMFDANLLPRSLLPTGTAGVEKSDGYLFRIHADVQSDTWCVVAWPEHHGNTGQRSFAITDNSEGGLETQERYSGFDRMPALQDVFENGINKAAWKKIE